MEIERDAVWWFRMILEASVLLVGTPGNALIIRVYAAKKNKATPHIFIIGLALADMTVCIMRTIPILLLVSQLPNSEFFCRVPTWIDTWQKYTSMLLTAAIAVDRYFAICRPHRAMFNNRRSRYTVIACFLFATVICSPFIFMYAFDEKTGTCFFGVPMWFIIAQFMQLVLIFIVSFIIIVVSYQKVFKTIRAMAKVRPGRNRRSTFAPDASTWNDGSTIQPNHPVVYPPVDPSSGQQALKTPGAATLSHGNTVPTVSQPTSSKTSGGPSPNFQKKVTLMLLLSTVIYFITITPTMLVLILYPVIIPRLGQSAALRTVVNVGSYISVVNHAANPFLYSFIDPRFRKECIKRLRCH